MSLKGSFRNAAFFIPSDDLELGRRNQVHEYPLRDVAYVEELGKKIRQYSFNAEVIGKDYKAARDKLIDALEKPGSGELVHPDYGTINVSITSAKLQRSSRQQGKVTFTISFVQAESQPRYPDAVSDTKDAVDQDADIAIASASDDFVLEFDVEGLPSQQLVELENELADAVAEIEQYVGDIASSAAAQIRAPANMAAIITGGVSRIANIITEPVRALALYKSLFNSGSSSPSIATTTATGKQQARSTDAIHRLLQRSAIAEASRNSANISYTTANDAITMRDELLLAIDNQMESVDPINGAPIADAVYQTLHDLRGAVAIDLRIRGAKLPQLTQHTPITTLPALVVAYNVYGDANRDAEIISRNNIRHPGFVPGGSVLEVLNV